MVQYTIATETATRAFGTCTGTTVSGTGMPIGSTTTGTVTTPSSCAQLTKFQTLPILGVFVFLLVLSNHEAFFLSRRALWKDEYILVYLETCSPTVSLTIISWCPIYVQTAVGRVVFQL